MKFNFSDYSTLSDGSISVAAESVVHDGARVNLTAGACCTKVKTVFNAIGFNWIAISQVLKKINRQN